MVLCPSERIPTRARVKAKQAQLLGEATWQIGKLAGPLKDELFNFLVKSGGEWGGGASSQEAGAFADPGEAGDSILKNIKTKPTNLFLRTVG